MHSTDGNDEPDGISIRWQAWWRKESWWSDRMLELWAFSVFYGPFLYMGYKWFARSHGLPYWH